MIVAAYQMIPSLLERDRKAKADRQVAIDRGSDEDWKAWKIVKTEVTGFVSKKLYVFFEVRKRYQTY